MNWWRHRFSQNMNKKLSRFLPCAVRAEILTFFCSYCWRNYDFINSFWNLLTFRLHMAPFLTHFQMGLCIFIGFSDLFEIYTKDVVINTDNIISEPSEVMPKLFKIVIRACLERLKGRYFFCLKWYSQIHDLCYFVNNLNSTVTQLKTQLNKWANNCHTCHSKCLLAYHITQTIDAQI